MDDAPAVTKEDVAQGRVAFCTPASAGRKRRRTTDPVGEEPRPWWAPGRDMGSRLDATAVGKQIVRKVYQKLDEWIVGRWSVEAGDSPIRMEEAWFSANRSIPTRMIAAELCGLASATLAKYWKEIQDNQGPLRPQKLGGIKGSTQRP